MKIAYSLSRTLSLKNNEYVKVELSLERECEPEEVDAAYKQMKDFCKDKLDQEEIEWKVGL